MTYSTLNTCILIGALALTACHKSEPEPTATPQAGPAAPAPQPTTTAQAPAVPDAKDTSMAGMAKDTAMGMAGKADTAMQAGMEAPNALTDQLSSKLGLTPAQASAGVGTILAFAKTKLPAADFDKVAAAVPGSTDYLQSAKDAGAVSDATPISDVTGLNSALGKLGISPEVAQQLIPQVSDYVSKVAGPEVGGTFKSLFTS
ncbi:MAG TPA: DUF2780 domain-containing protein [Gemmatimonadales bacterium]|nr:DUF2780 domain-containing protein [Gemmatimonadales bacterium]